MNICFMAYFPIIPYVGGVQRVTTLLSREFSNRGHSVVFLFYDSTYKNQLNDASIEYPQFYIDVDSVVEERLKSDMLEFVSKQNIDVIINQTPDEKSCRILNHVRGVVKIVSVCHSVPFSSYNATRRIILHQFPNHSIKLALYKWIALVSPSIYRYRSINKERRLYNATLRCSDKFVFISNRFFSRILNYMPDFPIEKLRAINNPNTYAVAYDAISTQKENIVLWVGRMDQNKNCIDFVRAWLPFSSRHDDWSAIVVGDGEQKERCCGWARKLHINNIEFVGMQADVKPFYNKAKIFVSTSLNESWGMALTEAMICGCVPCVYDTYETLDDIVNDGIDGVLCPFSPGELAMKLDALVSDMDVLQKMSENAVDKVSRFSASAICDQWISLLKEIY